MNDYIKRKYQEAQQEYLLNYVAGSNGDYSPVFINYFNDGATSAFASISDAAYEAINSKYEFTVHVNEFGLAQMLDLEAYGLELDAEERKLRDAQDDTKNELNFLKRNGGL